MKLVKFSVTNFRSILKAHDVPISNVTVLVGKNNEGKSNLLKALSIAMNIIKYYRQSHFKTRSGRYYQGHYDRFYDWARDFPISKSSKKGEKKITFKLEFELDDDEVKEFKEQIGSNLNGTLPLKIEIMQDSGCKVEVVKGGKGNKTLNSKANKITRYVAERISFNYIPAVRTHKQTLKVIDELLAYELYSLEDNPEYKDALKIIDNLQKPVLDDLSERIKEPLSEFLPDIKKVEINITERTRSLGYKRDFEVQIDDGTLTSIEQKGDGVQSLAALGLLKNKSRRTGASIIAIEEPESHLHPGAIHQLQKIIESLGSDNQIVLTTHNPLFVNRHSIVSNVIVDKGKANQAKNIKEIRDTLGVRVSDNLTNAHCCLIVEGAGDARSLKAILPILSPKIGLALKNNDLAIDFIGGAEKLSYKLGTLASQMCICHVFFDYDGPAKRQIRNAIDEGLLNIKNVTQTICEGMAQTEFEDCINPDIYKEAFFNEFGVRLDFTDISEVNQKWSNRVEQCFNKVGRSCDKKTKQLAKRVVVSCIEKNPSEALCKDKGNSIVALAGELERLLDSE